MGSDLQALDLVLVGDDISLGMLNDAVRSFLYLLSDRIVLPVDELEHRDGGFFIVLEQLDLCSA